MMVNENHPCKNSRGKYDNGTKMILNFLFNKSFS